METLSFILGIASVVVIATTIVAVYAVVKVSRVKKELDQFQISQSHQHESIYRNMHEEIGNVNRRMLESEQGIYSQMDSRFDKLVNNLKLHKVLI